MKKSILLLLILLFSLVLTITCTKNETGNITTGTLFEEMVNLKNLSEFPDPAYKTIQFSSFDRRSSLPGGPDWFANSDGFGGEPIPNFEKVITGPDSTSLGEFLIADVAGPGAVVRLWTAAINGTIKMYIDNADEPVYDGKADAFFKKVYDHFPEKEEIDSGLFDKTVSQRDACYAPIPFAKHLRVVWSGNYKKIHFYQLQVRLYEKTARVVSFSPSDIKTYKEVINKVTGILADPDTNLKPRPAEQPVPFTVHLAPSEMKEAVSLDGPKAVEILTLKLNAENVEKALRQTILHVYCDGAPWGQVQSPVGDFFGAAPGINPYRSLPFTVGDDGTMTCRFVMPFAKSISIKLENKGDQPVSVEGSALPMPYQWNERSLYFYARWRIDHDLIASNKAVQDLPFLIANGKGMYVGSASYLMNPAAAPTPYGNWWGEGDEKVFTDDDTVPSIFGTGSEDYYNYSWSAPDIFFFPYCGQPRNDGPGNRGFVTNYRWHILDPIPFKQSIRFYLELYHHEPTPGLSYARIGYHYARPGLTDDHLAIMPDDVRYLQLPADWQPAAIKGARNSVFYTAEKAIANKRSTTYAKGNLWQGSRTLVWHPRKAGDSKDFTFTVKKPGKKRIVFALGKTPESGIVSFKMNGKPALLSGKRDEIDLYRPFRTLVRRATLEVQELPAGINRVTVIFRGKNDTVKKAEVAIDFFWVQNIGN